MQSKSKANVSLFVAKLRLYLKYKNERHITDVICNIRIWHQRRLLCLISHFQYCCSSTEDDDINVLVVGSNSLSQFPNSSDGWLGGRGVHCLQSLVVHPPPLLSSRGHPRRWSLPPPGRASLASTGASPASSAATSSSRSRFSSGGRWKEGQCQVTEFDKARIRVKFS